MPFSHVQLSIIYVHADRSNHLTCVYIYLIDITINLRLIIYREMLCILMLVLGRRQGGATSQFLSLKTTINYYHGSTSYILLTISILR